MSDAGEVPEDPPAEEQEDAVPGDAPAGDAEEAPAGEDAAPAEAESSQPPMDGTEGEWQQQSVTRQSVSENEPDDEGLPKGLVSVDFVILPEGYGQTKRLDIRSSIAEIRKELEAELSIPEDSLFLMNMTGAAEVAGNLDPAKRLYEFGLNPTDKIGVELRINYYQEQPAEEYVMPDVLEISLRDAAGQMKVVSVYVERPTQDKPYLGGYRHKETRSEYHHAFTQTPRPQQAGQTVKYHRECQTYEYRTRTTQTNRDAGTQMPKSGVYIPTLDDVIAIPEPYFSSADLAALHLEKAVVIQCHARGMFARKRARQLRSERMARNEFLEQQAEKRRLESELRHKREIERRMHPKTYEDFEVLYSELEAWRQNETMRIKESGFDEETKHGALRQLLHKETKLLQTIDRLKISAHGHNRDAKIKKMLEAMSKPRVWAQQDGETTTVHTPFTTRAKELMDLYNGLRLPLLSVDERLDVLLHVKWTVKEFDCNLTREIVDLIDREADMLNRGRPEKSFKGLRGRLANLFLQFIETPEFNPEATRFQRVPREMYQQTAVAPLSTVPIKPVTS